MYCTVLVSFSAYPIPIILLHDLSSCSRLSTRGVLLAFMMSRPVDQESMKIPEAKDPSANASSHTKVCERKRDREGEKLRKKGRTERNGER